MYELQSVGVTIKRSSPRFELRSDVVLFKTVSKMGSRVKFDREIPDL